IPRARTSPATRKKPAPKARSSRISSANARAFIPMPDTIRDTDPLQTYLDYSPGIGGPKMATAIPGGQVMISDARSGRPKGVTIPPQFQGGPTSSFHIVRTGLIPGESQYHNRARA